MDGSSIGTTGSATRGCHPDQENDRSVRPNGARNTRSSDDALSTGCLFERRTPSTRCGTLPRKLDIAFTTEQSARGWQLNGTVHNRGLEEPFLNVTYEVGGDVTITLRTEGSAQLVIDAVRVAVDSDDDGLTDSVERTYCIPSGLGCHPTDPHNADSDGDTLEDGRETGQHAVRFVTRQVVEYYDLLSEPNTPHSDPDGLNDSVEVRGWDINVTTTSSGEALRWNGQNDSTTIRATSNPLAVHSDDDEVPDDVEKRRLHTRPNESVTYEITAIHQQQVVEVLRRRFARAIRGTAESIRAVGLVGADERIDLDRLDGGTDDFDFVLDDSRDIGFRALDGTNRSDTWLSNRRELVQDTEVWDADTDGDGLTDGQEVKGVTERRFVTRHTARVPLFLPDPSVSFETDPNEAPPMVVDRSATSRACYPRSPPAER